MSVNVIIEEIEDRIREYDVYRRNSENPVVEAQWSAIIGELSSLVSFIERKY